LVARYRKPYDIAETGGVQTYRYGLGLYFMEQGAKKA
jgi:hypothetical protein